MTDIMPRNFLTKPSSVTAEPVLSVREKHLAMPQCPVCGSRFKAALSSDRGKHWFCWPCRPEGQPLER